MRNDGALKVAHINLSASNLYNVTLCICIIFFQAMQNVISVESDCCRRKRKKTDVELRKAINEFTRLADKRKKKYNKVLRTLIILQLNKARA